jgi:hypothetical protein
MQRVCGSVRQFHHHHQCLARGILSQKGQRQHRRPVAAGAAAGACMFLLRLSSNHASDTTRTYNPQTYAGYEAEAAGPLPLFLVLNGQRDSNVIVRRPKLLLPLLAAFAATTTTTIASKTSTTNGGAVIGAAVSTIQDVLDAVNWHYSTSDDFVGGMGESDPGVFFIVPTTNENTEQPDDPLDHAELVTESILAVKEQRHGVPFGLYTTGIVSPSIPEDVVMSCLQRLHTLQVSLYAASPPDYGKATRMASMPHAQKAFGSACSFLAMVGENRGKLTLEVGLSTALNSSSAKAGRDLAMSLGAQQVHFY